jgi:uncharacterized protein (TIGR02596 family)
MSTQGDILRNQLSNAQQRALSSNADVEVRFFKFADFNEAATEAKFRAMQFYQYDDEGRKKPVSEVFRLGQSLVLSERYSNLLMPDPGAEEGRRLETVPNGQELFGSGVGGTVQYIAFRFRPDGSTDLVRTANNQTWYLTLVAEVGGAAPDKLPDNFYTIQVDQFNGTLREFRP